MSALGQKQTLQHRPINVRFTPKADIGTGPRYQLRGDNSGSLARSPRSIDRPGRREAACGHCLAGCTQTAASIKLSVCAGCAL